MRREPPALVVLQRSVRVDLGPRVRTVWSSNESKALADFCLHVPRWADLLVQKQQETSEVLTWGSSFQRCLKFFNFFGSSVHLGLKRHFGICFVLEQAFHAS